MRYPLPRAHGISTDLFTNRSQKVGGGSVSCHWTYCFLEKRWDYGRRNRGGKRETEGTDIGFHAVY